MSIHSQAWSCNNPDVVDEYLAARTAYSRFANRVNAAAQEIGNVRGAACARTSTDVATVGLFPIDDTDPPAGWRLDRTNTFVPDKGGKGSDARKWLEEHQPPAEVNDRAVLIRHGLPPNDIPHKDPAAKRGRITIMTPTIGYHDGTIWALFEGTPGDWMNGPQEVGEKWTHRNVSDFWVAAEARHHQLAAAGRV